MKRQNRSKKRLAFFSLLTSGHRLAVAQTLTDPCLTTTNELVSLESRVADTTVERVYSFCENTVVTVGSIDYNHDLVRGQEMLRLRPNMHVQCGRSGARENKCIIRNGNLLLDGTHYFGLSDRGALDNVVVRGFTFIGSKAQTAWITKPGTVNFIDCEFRNQGPVLADFSPPLSLPTSETRLSIVFRRCLFIGNRFLGERRHPSLVVGNGSRNRLLFEKTRWISNDMVTNNTMVDTNSFLISTSGPVALVKNCFEFNHVGVSAVAVYGVAEILSRNNFQNSSTGPKCSFISDYALATDIEAQTPSCIDFDSIECQADLSDAPTRQPSEKPSFNPTEIPSQYPSTKPRAAPTFSIPSQEHEAWTQSPVGISTAHRPEHRSFPPGGEPDRVHNVIKSTINRSSASAGSGDMFLLMRTAVALLVLATTF
mmetsp:Transcript_26447/g.60789  ORF Transcript_26447/g.60789 Transcript_26447/m.60789 type:complete len:426 (+) Transcript_26447:361-1638(+)